MSTLVWVNGLVGKIVAKQAWGPKFWFVAHTRNWAWNMSFQYWRYRGIETAIRGAHGPVYLNQWSSRSLRDPDLRNKMDSNGGKQQTLTSGIYTNTSTKHLFKNIYKICTSSILWIHRTWSIHPWILLPFFFCQRQLLISSAPRQCSRFCGCFEWQRMTE